MKEYFLVRIRGKDYVFSSVAKIRELLESGFCLPGSFVFSKSKGHWIKVCELEGISELFSTAPKLNESEQMYYLAKGYGEEQFKEGPFPFSKIRWMLKCEQLCESSWLCGVEQEWKQLKYFEEFSEYLVVLPEEKPSLTDSKLQRGLGTGTDNVKPPQVSKDTFKPTEPKQTTIINPDTEAEGSEYVCELQDTKEGSEDTMGGLDGEGLASRERTFVLKESEVDRIELPSKPIWYVKYMETAPDSCSGPYSFAKIIAMLENGEVSREDKVSLHTEKGFVKIKDQFEFNVNHKIEGERVFVVRKHFRVNYMTEVAVELKGMDSFMCDTLDISEGGAQLESKNKIKLPLNGTVVLSILPGIIKKKMKIMAKIIRIDDANESRFSVSFIDIGTVERALIQDFIRGSIERKYA